MSTLIFAQHPGINGLDNGLGERSIKRLVATIEGVGSRENFFYRATTRMGETTLFCFVGNGDVIRLLERMTNTLIKSRDFANITLTAVSGNTAEPTLTANEFLKG